MEGSSRSNCSREADEHFEIGERTVRRRERRVDRKQVSGEIQHRPVFFKRTLRRQHERGEPRRFGHEQVGDRQEVEGLERLRCARYVQRRIRTENREHFSFPLRASSNIAKESRPASHEA